MLLIHVIVNSWQHCSRPIQPGLEIRPVEHFYIWFSNRNLRRPQLWRVRWPSGGSSLWQPPWECVCPSPVHDAHAPLLNWFILFWSIFLHFSLWTEHVRLPWYSPAHMPWKWRGAFPVVTSSKTKGLHRADKLPITIGIKSEKEPHTPRMLCQIPPL